MRVILLVALVGGFAFLAYSLLVRDQLQVPLMASGFAVIGLVFGAMAVLALVSVVRSGRAGRDGTAVATALFGGLLAAAAMMALAGAVIMSMIWGGTTHDLGRSGPATRLVHSRRPTGHGAPIV